MKSHTPKQGHPWRAKFKQQPMKQPDNDRLKEYVEDWLYLSNQRHGHRSSDAHFMALCQAVRGQAEFRGVSTLELRSLYDALN